MLKNVFYIIVFAVISWGSYQISYPSNTPNDLYYEGVFFKNIIKHIEKITEGPRAVGDYYHDDVQRYLIEQLNIMGLEVSTQKSTSFNAKNKTAAPIRNIIATHKGNGTFNQSLLLLSHYDAAKFSGKGAADDASGVAVILESINALLKSNRQSNNDLVLLITDAEEVGLLGAHAFINEQLANHNIGLIINLEARGSSGPSMMWPETDGGNRAMIEAFAAAKVPLPVTTSLHYEIYKLLPNDTDLSPFSQNAKINGFNFAFIDNHFNYHTQRDSLENLSLNTLAHQTLQFHSMLKYFSNVDLSQMKATDSMVYFSLPIIGFISYPSTLSWILLLSFGLLFIFLLNAAKKRALITFKSAAQSLLTLILVGALGFGWAWLVIKVLYIAYPEFNDIMQGFPYSGHHIMGAVLVGSALIVVSVLSKIPKQQVSFSVVLNFLWLAVLFSLIYFLPGSGLLIWPVLLSIVLLTVQIFQPKLSDAVATVFAVCSFMLLGTLIINLPIALGINALPATAVFLTALLSLFIPMYKAQVKWLHVLLLMTLPLIYLIWHFKHQPTISEDHPHPTSLSYLYDNDSQTGFYFNFDTVNSGWNADLFTQSTTIEKRNDFWNKYRKPVKNLTQLDDPIAIEEVKIAVDGSKYINGNLQVNLTLTANSNTEVLEIFTHQALTIHRMNIEGRQTSIPTPIELKPGNRLLHYYFNGKKQIKLMLEISDRQNLDWQIQSHSLDLLNQEVFKIPPRPPHQIPKPFIKSDNIVVVQSFTFGFNE